MLSKVENIEESAAHGALKERKTIYLNSKIKEKKCFHIDSYGLRKEVIRLERKMYTSKVTHEQRIVFLTKKRVIIAKTFKL